MDIPISSNLDAEDVARSRYARRAESSGRAAFFVRPF